MKVESFQLDHTKVRAPYVRNAGVYKGSTGDYLTKFDLRFLQPNKGEMPTSAVHTLEHLLAGYMREELQGIIDVSPMGCRTGFYLIIWGDRKEEEIQPALVSALKKVLQTEEVPAANEIQCGNYRDHSLFAAKEYVKLVLKGFQELS
jgi:S-ribosylhomocysteine lyase